MSFLPIIGRELRVASRRRSTYWSRFQIGVAATVPTAFLLTGPIPFGSAAKMGEHTFQVLANLALFSVMLSAARSTADCLSSEKRDGTLGFLFLTDLKAVEVITGKLGSSSLAAMYALLGLLPVLTLPILCGGVTVADVLRLALVLLNSLFFALSLAMLISAFSWQERNAVGMTLLLLFAIGVGLPFAGAVAGSTNGRPELASILCVASPGFACSLVREAMYVRAPLAFWISVAITHGMGWFLFTLACEVLPRVWQDRPAEGRFGRWRELCRRVLMGNASTQTTFRRRLLGVNPIYWLTSRERRACWYPWIFLASMAGIGGATCWILRVKTVDIEPLIFCSFLLNWFFKHWVANAACFAFSTDGDRGALELLLSTPLKIRALLRGHWLGLRHQFLVPILVLIAAEVALLSMAMATEETGGYFPLFWVVAFVSGLMVFQADLVALVWVGLWSGLVAKNASGAVSATYARVMLLPWLVVMLGVSLLSMLFEMDGEANARSVLVLWVVTSLLADLFFGFSARWKLLTELRVAATRRYGGSDSSAVWWRRLGRWLAPGEKSIPSV
jgi:hypothetical protein